MSTDSPLTTTTPKNLKDEPGVHTASIIVAVVFGVLCIAVCIGFLIFGYYKIRKQPEKKKDPEAAQAIGNEEVKADAPAPAPECHGAQYHIEAQAASPKVKPDNHPSTFCESMASQAAVQPSKEGISTVSNN